MINGIEIKSIYRNGRISSPPFTELANFFFGHYSYYDFLKLGTLANFFYIKSQMSTLAIFQRKNVGGLFGLIFLRRFLQIFGGTFKVLYKFIRNYNYVAFFEKNKLCILL